MTFQMQSCIRAILLVWVLAFGMLPKAAGAVADTSGSPRRKPLPALEAPIQREMDAAQLYDEVGDGFRALDRAMYDALPPNTDDPQAVFIATGLADERMALWLRDARPLGDKLIAASTLEYHRAIDPQDGFALGPAYLAPLRTTNRSVPLLIHDAALRGEVDRLAELLRVQVILAQRTATDGTLPSSISAISTVQQHMLSVGGLLERGMVDAATARKVVEMRLALADIRDYGTAAAMQAELDALKIELDRILLTPIEERPAAVAGLRITVPVNLDDNTIVAARQGAEAYLTSIVQALGEGDLHASRQRIVIAEQRLRDGAFGELLKVLAPQVLPTVDLLVQSRADMEAQRRVLESIALGESSAPSHADAGWYYQHAARAALKIPLKSQSAIEELRVSDAPNGTAIAEARKAIDACRDGVITPMLLADKASRCSLPTHPPTAAGTGLIRASTLGMNAAVRVLLADSFGGGTRSARTPTRGEAAAISLRIAARFSLLGTYSHALVAHQILRDLQQPLLVLEKRGELTPKLRNDLLSILAQMSESDPLGFMAAGAGERSWLASQTFPNGDASIVAFDRAQLAKLTPNEIVFLLAMFTAPSQAPYDAPRGSPLDGALVDIRSWFDLSAFKRAAVQIDVVRSRAQRATNSAVPINDSEAAVATDEDSAVTWLDVTVPLDVEARMQEALADYKATLRRITPPTTISRKRP